jgi:hypothetical protein
MPKQELSNIPATKRFAAREVLKAICRIASVDLDIEFDSTPRAHTATFPEVTRCATHQKGHKHLQRRRDIEVLRIIG